MDKKQIYPQNIENLLKKINYIIDNEQNIEKIKNLIKWKEWYESLNYKFEYVCEDNEFLKAYYDNNKYALQIWYHGTKVDSIVFNLVANYYSEYDNEITEVIE